MPPQQDETHPDGAAARPASAEERARISAEESPLPTAITGGPGHQLRHINDAFRRQLGRTGLALCDRRLPELSDDPEALGRLLDRALAHGVPCGGSRLSFATESGELLRATVVASPLGGAAGCLVVHLVELESGDGREPNELMRAANQQLILTGLREQELAAAARQSADELRALLEAMSEGVAVFDAAGELVLANACVRHLLDLPHDAGAAELRRAPVTAGDGAPVDIDEDLLAPLWRKQSFVGRPLTLVAGAEHRRDLQVSGTAVADEHGSPRLALLVFRDVTPQRELDRLREQYTALVTHDLRAPLSTAMMAARLATDDRLPLERRGALMGNIVGYLARMDRMLGDLLDAQRLRAGKPFTLHLTKCDLVELVREVAASLEAVHPGRLVVRAEGHVQGICGAAEVERAVWNLVRNAIQHGSDQTPITLTVERRGESAAISVHNEGPPIPPERQQQLFEAYARDTAPTEPRQQAGSRGWGLGLALVRACAEAHGGSVRVDSSAEAGTTFEMVLPLDAGAAG